MESQRKYYIRNANGTFTVTDARPKDYQEPQQVPETPETKSIDEDLELRRKELEDGIMGKNRQKVDTKYNYTHIDIGIVMSNPDEYIIPELKEACKKLWNKNIFTFMCSNRQDAGCSWIETFPLSKENNEVFKELKKRYPKNIKKIRGDYVRIDFDTSKMGEDEISKLFVGIVEQFKQQDIQKQFYDTPEGFLIGCGCFKEIIDKGEKLKKGNTKIVFDATKMTKTLEEYAEEKNAVYDPKLKRIYSGEFYKRHLDYISKFGEIDREIEA